MDYKVTDTELTSIANAIRTKGGTSQPLTFPNEFITAVENIPTGGGTLQTKSKTYTPTTSQQTESVQPDSGYDGLSKVNITVNAMPVGTEGTPTATKGTVSNHSVSVTPSVTNTAGYISGGTKSGTAVTVSASELVSGSETKTENGTYDVTNLAELIVNVEGGASNFVTRTFTTPPQAGVTNLSIPYTGSGYPIACIVVVDGGAYVSGTDWYNLNQKYAVGQWTMTKADMSTAPSYGTSGANNQGVTTWIYKNTSATSYARSSAMTTNVFSSSNSAGAGATCVRFKSGNVLSFYTNTTSYGLAPNTKYTAYIVYSE